MKSRFKAFTLAELLVVMGIIVLFIALAIPAVRSMTGSGSTSVARNELAALITRAREEAVGVQSIRGVLFYVDPGTNRVVGVICQAASNQDPNLPASIVLLDAVPSRDTLLLPQGIRLQTVYNGASNRYLGFNPENSVNIGGCILFDGNGKLIAKPYGFQMAQLNGSAAALSTLGGILYGPSTALSTLTSSTIVNSAPSVQSYAYVPGYTTTAPTSTPSPALAISQLGLVLFDNDSFVSANTPAFLDADNDPNEALKETWIDTNSTPVMINRYNGTLIRGE